MPSERHGRISEIFLGACELQGEERSAYLDSASAGDGSLRVQVEALLARDQVCDHPLDVGGGADHALPTQIGPYRVMHELGHGGMSAVYLAVRQSSSFKQRVAIKVLKRGIDTDAALARFGLERQLLAALNHPYIGRLYDAGETDDGRPYIVMELVEGQRIDKYCDRHRLSITARLKLFRKVCEAVQYAHRNLVVHRDLKPGNIIVTEEGVPKLLDFGIAKLVNPELSPTADDPTAPGHRIMSPEYASPEQVRGERVTTASDVYSLGVILYELVCGHRPYRLPSALERAVIERIVCYAEPEKPSIAVAHRVLDDRDEASATITPQSASATRERTQNLLRRRLKGDIDTIVLMAIRKEPERRYTTVEQLSNDIRRHLEGLPVIARRDTVGYRARKFVGRHKAGVAVAVLALSMILAGLTVAWQGARADVAEARAHELANHVGNFARVVLGRFHDEVAALDGSLPVRELLVREALAELDRCAKGAVDNLEVRRQLAFAYDLLGNIQAGPDLSLGDTTGAIESHRTAARLREPLLGALPDDPELLGEFGRNQLQIGRLLIRMGLSSEAHEVFKRACAIYEDLNSVDLAWRGDLCVALRSRAYILRQHGDLDEAERLYDRAVAYGEELAREDPDNSSGLNELATVRLQAGSLQRTIGRTAAAFAEYEHALDLFQRMCDVNPGISFPQSRLAFAHTLMAEFYLELKQPDAALAHLERALPVFQHLAERNPRVAPIQTQLALAHRIKGHAHVQRSEWPLARASFEANLSLILRLTENSPDDNLYRASTAIAVEGLGDVDAGVGDAAGALELYGKALRTYEEVVARDPGHPWWQDLQLMLLRKLGLLEARLGDGAGGRELLMRTWDASLARFDSRPPAKSKIEGLVGSYRDLARFLAEDDPAALARLRERTVATLSVAAASYHRAGYDDRAVETLTEALEVLGEAAPAENARTREALEAQLEGYRALDGHAG